MQNKLLALVEKSLQDNAILLTEYLGDRTKYIGLSDIGKYMECPRSAVLSKQKQNYDLQRQLILQRGRWLETGFSEALKTQKFNILEQLEISINYQGVPIKAHLDFVFVSSKAVRILELKTTETIPETLYASYEYQLYGQVGLLYKYWNEPVFNGNFTFSELCQKSFGFSPTKDDVEAWIVILSMSNIKTFGAYSYNQTMLDICLDNAVTMWNDLQSDTELGFAYGLYPLCASCSFSADCPKFTGVSATEFDDNLEFLGNLKSQKDSIEKQISEIEASLKTAYSLANISDWLLASKYRFRVSTQTRKTLNKDKLKEELAKSKIDADILGLCEMESKPFDKLTISKIT